LVNTKKTEREKIVKQGKGQSFPNFSSSDMFYFDSQTEMILVGKKPKTQFLKEFLKPGFDDRGNEEGEINYQALHIESLVEQDLGLSKHLIQKLNNDNVERLKKSINFENVLDQILEQITDQSKKRLLVKTLAIAFDYAKNVKDEAFRAIKKRIGKYFKKIKIKQN